VTVSQPATLVGRAALRLAEGPLDALTLMRHVCRIDRLRAGAADRMALALLGGSPLFVQLPSGHWALQDDRPRDGHRATSGGSLGGGEGDTAASLPDIAFAVVDVETTGTRAGGADRITEVAIVRVVGGAIRDRWSHLVNPGRPIPTAITALTGISDAMVAGQPAFPEIAAEVTSRLGAHVFAAHNAAFDWRFVSEELARGTGRMLAGPRLCTVRLARLLLPELPRRSLDHVARHLGVSIDARHRAAGDAEATARVLLRLLDIAGDRGVSSWPALQALLAPGGQRRLRAADRRRRAFPHPFTPDDPA
jgi:DNA polymerase-3 subunit epsilon